ncbi:SGNH/GDSL hydrolase family protein [Cryobacterium sp. TMT1-2-1]|uniref:SGNH/GDSL hydrolase family protein n=1 Tax=Cryobacterium sp. TMT1-2-1 TaxID=1259232 RepID=UPI00106907A5|nr:SGNH/GDSL hydrolase family protein [Cryobacterium sp. TMT1-2-1]TFD46436.1 SGNH/GDSL hydrolase family protein [Cryobacterium sp. TMT1-2-1]
MTNSQNRTRSLSRLGALSLLSVALVVGVVAAPATAAPSLSAPTGPVASSNATRAGLALSAPLGYVALGDSFTSGQGAPPYSDATCQRSRYKSYPVISSLLSPYRLSANKACSGARMADIPAQLAGVSATTTLVTITVGGIDAGSTAILQACAPDPASVPCGLAVQTSGATLSSPAFVTGLAQTYGYIAATLPNARVAVLNYPLLFQPGVSPLGDLVNQGTAGLNSAINLAVTAIPEPAGVDRIRYIDATQEFAGHGIGSAVPYIAFNPANLLAPSNFHPNALGNTFGYYRALVGDGVLRR